ncbi:ABC transporter permease [Mycobacterium sp. C31M]
MRRISGRYVVQRIGQALLVVWLSFTFVFFALFLLPGDPIRNAINHPENPLPDDIAAVLLGYYHLDEPWYTQYWLSLTRALTGDIGYSITTGREVTDVLAQAIPETLKLASLGLLVAVLFAFLIALLSVYAPWQSVRKAARLIPPLFLSTPSFLIALILLQFFSFQLGLVSAVRDEGYKSYILPALTLGIAVSAPIAVVLGQGLERVSRESFVIVLRSAGASEKSITIRNVLKNAAIPALTLLGLTVGELLAGSVVTETIFSRAGIGLMTNEALKDQDTPVLLAVVLFVSIVFVTVSLVTDLVYPLIDPRITLGNDAAEPELVLAEGVKNA